MKLVNEDIRLEENSGKDCLGRGSVRFLKGT